MAASSSIHDKLRELYLELLAENNSEANKVSDSSSFFSWRVSYIDFLGFESVKSQFKKK